MLITWKNSGHIWTFYILNDCSTIGDNFFSVRGRCEIWYGTYGSKTHCSLLLLSNFCVHIYKHSLKTTGQIWTFCISNNCSTIRDIFVRFRVAWEIWLEGYDLHHHHLFSNTLLCAYTASLHIHCNLVHNYAWQQNSRTLWLHATHQTMALLPTTSYTTCYSVFF